MTAISWVGPAVLGLLRKREAFAASETMEQAVAASMVGATSEDKLLFGIYTKLTTTVMAAGKSPSRNGEALFDVMRNVQSDWQQVAKRDVRQLPDPALVAMAEALQSSPYSIEFFRVKLTRLVTNYDEILKIGKHTSYTQPDRPPLVAVRVRHVNGVERLALAQPTTKSVPIKNPKLGPEPGDDARLVKDGNYAFHDWIDRSLAPVVAVDASTPILASNDARWRMETGSPSTSQELARWHDDPATTNDVNMLALPKNPFVPKGQQ